MRWLLLLLLALPAAAEPVLDRLYAHAQREGVVVCTPREPLATLLRDAPSCALDFDACELAMSAARGVPVAPELVEVLVDLVGRAEGQWQARCPGDGPHFLHQTGIKGLASVEGHLDALLALTTPEELVIIGENSRRLLAETLYWRGEAAAAPGLLRLLAHSGGLPDFKTTALLALTELEDASERAVAKQRERATGPASAAERRGNPPDSLPFSAAEASAVPFCATPQDDAPLEGLCLQYLAVVQAPGALARIEAASAQHSEAAARALGRLGEAGLPLLKKLAAHPELATRLAAQVSLLELGDETYLGSLVAALQAPEKLFRDRLERMKRAPKRAKKPKKTRTSRRGRRPPPPPKPPSARVLAAQAKEAQALDLAVRVAMECGHLRRPHERLDKALRGAARVINPLRPQAHTAALLALAQRGDLQAIQEVAALLVGSVDPIRTQVLEAVGALALEPWLPSARRGRGVVAHPALVPALATLADDAETYTQRALTLRAMRNVRRALMPVAKGR
jgi:hypothetical protein